MALVFPHSSLRTTSFTIIATAYIFTPHSVSEVGPALTVHPPPWTYRHTLMVHGVSHRTSCLEYDRSVFSGDYSHGGLFSPSYILC